MRINVIMSRIRNISHIMIHTKSGASKSMDIDELDVIDGMLEFEWFEVTTFMGKPCIEFTLIS